VRPYLKNNVSKIGWRLGLNGRVHEHEALSKKSEKHRRLEWKSLSVFLSSSNIVLTKISVIRISERFKGW
jgi:hypothetical protein